MPDDTAAETASWTIVDPIRTDLTRLHESWMGLLYPRQRHDRHPVLGKWRPDSTMSLLGYRLWAVVGVPLVVFGYPFVLLGVVLRFYTRSLDRTVKRLGLVGVIVLVAIVWGILTGVARIQFDTEGFLAVAAAAIVATVSAGIAVIAHTRGGRASTVLIAYPAGVTAIFLPPVVAALFSPSVSSVVFPRSEALAIWILDELLFVGGLNELIRDSFDLEGLGFVWMWLAISVPIGWFLGTIVTLAEVIRPTETAS